MQSTSLLSVFVFDGETSSCINNLGNVFISLRTVTKEIERDRSYGGRALRRSDQFRREDRCVQTQACLLFPFFLDKKIHKYIRTRSDLDHC